MARHDVNYLYLQDCDGHVDIGIGDNPTVDTTMKMVRLDLPTCAIIRDAIDKIMNDPDKNWDPPTTTVIGRGGGL